MRFWTLQTESTRLIGTGFCIILSVYKTLEEMADIVLG